VRHWPAYSTACGGPSGRAGPTSGLRVRHILLLGITFKVIGILLLKLARRIGGESNNDDDIKLVSRVIRP